MLQRFLGGEAERSGRRGGEGGWGVQNFIEVVFLVKNGEKCTKCMQSLKCSHCVANIEDP